MKKKINCVVCGSSRSLFIENVRRIFKFKIYRCKNCGLFFQHPIPSKKKLQSIYEGIYDKKFNLPCAEKAFEVPHSDSDLKKIAEIKKFFKRGTLLDIGASTGFFVKSVNDQKGWSAHGIEYSSEAVRKAKNNFKIHIIQGEVTSVKTPLKTYNVVTMYAVLDHIPDIHKTLDKIYEKTRSNGLLVLNVQNSNSWEYLLYKLLHKSYAGFIFEHLYYFNKHTITLLLKKHNFRVIHITSRKYSPLSLPPKRPLIGWLTFIPKLFLEYTSFGGQLLLGNTITVYARKI